MSAQWMSFCSVYDRSQNCAQILKGVTTVRWNEWTTRETSLQRKEQKNSDTVPSQKCRQKRRRPLFEKAQEAK